MKSDSLLEEIEKLIDEGIGKILISAYPGFGKTRLIPKIVDILARRGINKILIFVRSLAEIEEVYKFFKNTRLKATCLVGREKLCPFNAKNINECTQFRDRGICQLNRVRGHVNIHIKNILNYRDIVELSKTLNTCPYDLSFTIALQSQVVITTITYLSNMELYRIVKQIVQNCENYGVIIDEAHTVITGIEQNVEVSRESLKIFRDLSENEEIVIIKPRFNIDNIKQSSHIDIENILYTIFTDLLYIKSLSDKFIIKTLTISSVQDLIDNSQICILLSASITEKFKNLSKLIDNFYKIFIEDVPSHIDNLKVYIVCDVEFNERFKYTRMCINILQRILSSIIKCSPLVGGIVILFSSKKFLKYFIDNSASFLKYLDVRYFILMDSDVDIVDRYREISHEDRCILFSYVGSPICEGINFLGDELVTLVLVGFPFPEFSRWNFYKMNFLKRYCENSFIATFLFPAISITIQTVGRAMRDLDKRVKRVFLIDRRFLKYSNYFPKWFPKPHIMSISDITESFGLLL